MEKENNITREVLTDQTLIHALFHVIDMGGDDARDRAAMLGGIILSNRLSEVNNQEDMNFVENMITQLQSRITEDLKAEHMHDRETHEELIHAYVSLSKALEYAKLTVK